MLDVSAGGGGGVGGVSQAHTRSPPLGSSAAAGSRVLRSAAATKETATGGGGIALPTQSLRDSPFMRSAPLGSSSSAAALHSTPFTVDASPIRPLNNNDTPMQQQEHKESDMDHATQTPAPSARALFDRTPFASPPHISSSVAESPWIATPAASSSSSSSTSLPPSHCGLGFSRPHPCAVTVFGFGPSTAGRVLSRFYALGEVLAREEGSAAGETETRNNNAANWVHLLYATPIQASMALALNGRVVEGVMVGVKLRSVENDATTATTRGTNKINSRSGFNTPAAERNGSIFERSARKTPANFNPNSIYATPATATAASSSSLMHPAGIHKSICSRLMEYLFNY